MQRRQFLEISGVIVAGSLTAGLSGCGGGSSSSSAGSSGGGNLPPISSGPDWKSLANGMQGSLLLPSASNFATAALVFNARFNNLSNLTPTAIARCASATDVAYVLAFAQKNNVAITPRCGGHSFGGYSTGSGLIIDVGPMNSVQVNNDGTATIGAGAKLADVYSQLIAKGVCIPSGSCLSVGIAGITMGGGIGLLDRKYGLTCDNLVSAQIVTADGKTLTCDAIHEPELFWALRGGGGGNFGVATSFTFKTHAIQDLATASITFSYADSIRVLQAWQNWPATLPNAIWAQLNFNFFNPNLEPTLSFYAVSVGSQSELQSHVQSMISTLGVPVTVSYASSAYANVIMDFCTGRTVSQCHLLGQSADATIQPYAFASSSDFYDQALPANAVQTLLDGISEARTQGIGGQILLDLMGGAIADVAPDATAFVHRNALFSAEYFMNAAPGSTPTWSNAMRQRMQPWSSGRAYVNYIDPLITNWKAAYYGNNYARLAKVKLQYDPMNVFHSPQSVQTS